MLNRFRLGCKSAVVFSRLLELLEIENGATADQLLNFFRAKEQRQGTFVRYHGESTPESGELPPDALVQ